MSSLTVIAQYLQLFWPHLVAGGTLVVMLVASAHLVLYKRDTRAAIGWIAVIMLVPLLGSILYALLGINRVQRRAITLRGAPKRLKIAQSGQPAGGEDLVEKMAPASAHLAALARLVGALTRRALLPGNRLLPLVGGEQAYREMLTAIDAAESSITLSTYIFDNDRTGDRFVESLAGAVERGVEVRVLIDDIGARYTFPSIVRKLRKSRVTVATFMPTLVRRWFAYSNLRSHRKILVVDGRTGFTGGMNIREGEDLSLKPKHPTQDLHFRVEGPVVAHLQEVFAGDWAFATGELLQGKTWFPKIEPTGQALARGVATGPDEDSNKLRLTLEGAVSCARSSIVVMTPYFLPETPLIAALNVAALRGVEVDIILPEENNLQMVKWASIAQLWQVLERGCRVWLTPPPFDHTKLMVVDRAWTFLGSANWDPRSLRLNFEFNVECYDNTLSDGLHEWMLSRRKRARAVTLKDVDGRRLPVRLRDGVVRLFSPYL